MSEWVFPLTLPKSVPVSALIKAIKYATVGNREVGKLHEVSYTFANTKWLELGITRIGCCHGVMIVDGDQTDIREDGMSHYLLFVVRDFGVLRTQPPQSKEMYASQLDKLRDAIIRYLT